MNDHTHNTPEDAQGRTQAPSEHATHDDAIAFTELTAGAEVTIIINGAEMKQVIQFRCGDIDSNLFDNGNPIHSPGGTLSMDFQNASIVRDTITEITHPARPTTVSEGELIRDRVKREEQQQSSWAHHFPGGSYYW